ncbi:MAG: caspase family protein [bacterium]|jgi:hypothetical protein
MTPENTYAFLIAVENYSKDDQLHQLPHSFNNVAALHKVLKGSTVGLPKKNIKTDFDPTNATELIEKLQNHVDDDEAKTLIIYYAGHGVLDDDGSHYLTLTNSTVKNIAINGLDINYLNKAFANKKNLNLILILDSCFSESAFESFKARNYLVIASSAKNRTSKYPVDADYSAFTQELITILKDGIDNKSEYLTWKDVYTGLKNNLKEKGFPQPRISAQNEVDMLEIARNNFNNAEVSLDDQWVKIIKEDMGKNNPRFKEKVIGILNSGSPQTVNKLKEHLLNSFPYPIAYYLNKVFEKNPTPETYIELYENIIRFLFTIGFIEFEQVKQSKGLKPGDMFRQHILNFDEPDHEFYFGMLEALSNEFKTHKVSWFLKEFDYFDKEFLVILKNLEEQRKNKESNLASLRTNIFKLISKLDFLLDYKLVSVKDVNLSYRKYDSISYNHSVSILQGTGHTQYEVWDEVSEPWQKAFVRHDTAKNNRSVLFLNCGDTEQIEYLNLWPLIIDKNVLDQKANTPQIFLYAGKDEQDNYLYQNIRDTEVIGKKTYSELEAFAATSKIEKFNEIFAV